MPSAHRTLVLGLVALGLLAFATGMTAGSKPANEEAYWHELSRLNTADKAGALVLAMKGDDWYPGTGPNAEARKAMVITLLVDLGRIEEARNRTRAFMARFPRSQYLPLVQGVTGIHPRPHGPRSNP